MRKVCILLPFVMVLILLSACNKKQCEHEWGNVIQIKEATCISEGEAEHTCSKCNLKQTFATEKTDHKKSSDYKYDDNGHFLYCTVCDMNFESSTHILEEDEIITPPTAYDEGVQKMKCLCGYTTTKKIDSAPHQSDTKYDYDDEYHWYNCLSHEDCTIVFQKAKHTLVEGDVILEPTNDTEGIKEIHCMECAYVSEISIPSFNHIKTGDYIFNNNEHWYQCGNHPDCEVKVEKEAHDLKNYDAKSPTCSEVGWHAYKECTKCDYTTYQEIERLEHEYTLIHTDEANHYMECKGCHDKKEIQPHEYTLWKVTQMPTLYTNGVEVKSCACGHLSNESRALPAEANFKNDFSLENSNGIWKYGAVHYRFQEETFDFTHLTNHTEDQLGWIADGIEIKKDWITVNNYVGIGYQAERNINISINVHFVGEQESTRLALRVGVKNKDEVLYSSPSFYGTTTNVLEVSVCYSLNEGDTVYFIFSNEAHSDEAIPSGQLNIQLKPATYKEGYMTDDDAHWKVCDLHDNCNMKFDFGAHDWKMIQNTATCTEEGIILYECSVCKKTKEESSPALNHKFDDIYIANDEEGHYQICSICNYETPLESHTMIDNGIKQEATESENGIMNTICSICQYESTRIIPALSHISSGIYDSDDIYHWHTCGVHSDCDVKLDYEKHTWNQIEDTSTCTEDGIKTYQCSVCLKTKEEVAYAGHEYGILIEKQEKTCTENGMKAHYLCSKCHLFFDTNKTQVTEESLIILAGHELVQYEGQLPTCTEIGWNAYEACSQCDYTTYEEIDALGHSYTFWTQTEKPTLYHDGVETIRCSCGHLGKETRVLPAEANFKNDFTLDDSDGVWKYGSINYHWADETFDFTPLVDYTTDQLGWATEGIEIKPGWINANQMLGIAYTIEKDVYVKITLKFIGSLDSTKVALRVGIKNGEGVLYQTPTFYGTDTNQLEVIISYGAKTGDTIYFIFSNEAASDPNGELSIKLQKCPDFKNDFSLDDSDGVWKYGSIDYHWADETFDFTNLTEKTEDNTGWKDNGIQIKSGWIDAGSMLGIAYTAEKEITFKSLIQFTKGTEKTKIDLRVGIKDKNGNLKSSPSFYGDISKLELDYTLQEGETIYFMFSNGASDVEGAFPNGDLNITLS